LSSSIATITGICPNHVSLLISVLRAAILSHLCITWFPGVLPPYSLSFLDVSQLFVSAYLQTAKQQLPCI